MIDLRDNSAAIAAAMDRLARAADNRAPLMRAIAGVMHDEVEENFAQEGRPKWLGLAPGTIASRRKAGKWPGKILQRSAAGLASSIEQGADNDSAWVGTNKKYAAIQHFGGKTGAHVILPRNKKALAFNGRVVKRVNHPGSKIPARSFLAISPEGEEKILGKVSDYLARAVG